MTITPLPSNIAATTLGLATDVLREQTPVFLEEQPAPDTKALLNAKASYSTRFVHAEMVKNIEGFSVTTDPYQNPSIGDVVIARVTSLGHHKRLEGPGSRRQHMFVGDEIIVAYGSRYAPDQFEAFLPENLAPTNLVAAGGMASTVSSHHSRISRATSLQPIGLLNYNGKRVNLKDFAPHSVEPVIHNQNIDAKVILVFGSSMNSGKSEVVTRIVKGLDRAQLKVVAGKATGTGSGNDPLKFADAGAQKVLDFTDFGYPSTFRVSYNEIRAILINMHAALAAESPDVIVIEIADGLFQPDTARLINDPAVHSLTDRVVYASADSLGAVTGTAKLQDAGFDVACLSGVVTSSPLARREANEAISVDVINTFDFDKAHIAQSLVYPCN